MTSLDGLPPLPKSLSGFNLLEFNVYQTNSPLPFISSDKSVITSDDGYAPVTSEKVNIGNCGARNYLMNTPVGIESSITSRHRTSPNSRDLASGVTYKQITDTSPISSTRVSPIINSSRSTPLSSSRGSPNIVRGSTPPTPGLRGSTPPAFGCRSLYSSSLSPRQQQGQLNLINGVELPAHTRPGRLFTLDSHLSTLRKEMFSLRQMDLSLLNQLWSLNEAIQDFRHLQEENASTFPPSPGSCDDSDEFYSPLSTLKYQNMSNFQLPMFAGKLSSSSSESSIEFGDV